MEITLRLTDAQEKALSSRYASIQEFVQSVVANRSDRIINEIVACYANRSILIDKLTADEHAIIDSDLANRIIVTPSGISQEVKAMIVNKAQLLSDIDRIDLLNNDTDEIPPLT